MSLEDNIKLGLDAVAADVGSVESLAKTVWMPIGGFFLLNDGEINGWGRYGPFDEDVVEDLGNWNSTNLTFLAGGYCFPFNVKITGLYAWHANNNAAADPWGWVITRQNKTANSTTRSTTFILDEVADNSGVGPRNYLNANLQLTNLDLSSNANNTVTAGDIITLGVSCPSGSGSYRVQVLGGYILGERV